MARALFGFYGASAWKILGGGGLGMCLTMVIPILNRQLLTLIEQDGDILSAVVIACSSAVLLVVVGVIGQQAWNIASVESNNAWLALTALVYLKPSRLARADLDLFSEGSLIALISADCQAILEVGGFFFLFALMPWQLVMAVAQLTWLLGWVFIFGFVVLVCNSDWVGFEPTYKPVPSPQSPPLRATLAYGSSSCGFG